MTDAEIIRKDYEDKLSILQNTLCPHKESEWIEHHFAPGHFGGMVRCCKNCDLILETNPSKSKFFIDDEEVKE